MNKTAAVVLSVMWLAAMAYILTAGPVTGLYWLDVLIASVGVGAIAQGFDK